MYEHLMKITTKKYTFAIELVDSIIPFINTTVYIHSLPLPVFQIVFKHAYIHTPI